MGGRFVAVVITVLAVAVGALMGGFNEAGDSAGEVALEALGEVGELDGSGCSGGRFRCSGELLRRWAIAVWVIRALGLTPEPAPVVNRSPDVGPDVW